MPLKLVSILIFFTTILAGTSTYSRSNAPLYLANNVVSVGPIRVTFAGLSPNDHTIVVCQDHSKIDLTHQLFKTAKHLSICQDVQVEFLHNSILLKYGESAALLFNGSSADSKILDTVRKRKINASVIKIQGSQREIAQELLRELKPRFAVITSEQPDLETVRLVSEEITSRYRPLMQIQVSGCLRDDEGRCGFTNALVNENLSLTSEGPVEFQIWRNAVEKIDVSEPEVLNVDCRSDKTDDFKSIRVSRIFKHTGILIPRSDLSKLGLREDLLPPSDPWIDISWGDETLFLGREEDNTISNYVAAGWMQRPAAIKIASSAGNDSIAYIDLKINSAGYEELLKFIRSSIYFDQSGSPVDRSKFAASELKSPDIIFFAANVVVPIPRSCNKWSAIALQHAGCPTWPTITLTNNQLWETFARLQSQHAVSPSIN